MKLFGSGRDEKSRFGLTGTLLSMDEIKLVPLKAAPSQDV
jgi:hypothetical protein